MFRVSIWRFLCVLALVSSALQIVGFFLPFSLTIDIRTHTTVLEDSYWEWLIHPRGTFVGAICCSPLAFLSLLLPLGTALRELVNRPQRSSRMRLASLFFAILWLMQYLLLVVGAGVTASFCVADDPKDCYLQGDFGPGLLPTFIGSCLLIGCFFTLLLLERMWWRCDAATEGQKG